MERRLAAILAADVIGYTRLMGADEAGTLGRLFDLRKNSLEPLIGEHRGRVVKLTGDGLLIEFASIVDAMKCAVAWQDAVEEREKSVADHKRITFRIGVNLGDVLVDEDDIFGDGVNIAARLESLADPGGICLSGDAYRHVKGKVDVAFEDLGEQVLKNVAEPVHVFRVVGGNPIAAEHATAGSGEDLAEKPSIAVLPFVNMSGDPEQEYFSDGIAEDIITELSRFRSLIVIARNSSFTYRGRTAKVQEIGADLGVQYLVEGSLRKAGNRIRISVQTVEAATGKQIWAHRYDRDLKDIFAVQDEVSQSIVATLPGRLEQADAERAARKHTNNMTAYDFVLRGNQHLARMKYDDNVEAQRMYENAIELDASYAHAYARLSAACFDSVFIWSRDDAAKSRALEFARKALALDANDSWSHASLGLALMLHKEDRQAEIYLRKAIELNPNEAHTAAFLAEVTLCWGRPEESLEWSALAMRLNPHCPDWYRGTKAEALYLIGAYERSVQTLMEMTVFDHWDHRTLAAGYGQLGRRDDAGRAWGLFLAEWNLAVERGEDVPSDPVTYALEEDLFRRESDRRHWLEGLRLAGIAN